MGIAPYIFVYDRPEDGEKTVERKNVDFEAFVAAHGEEMPLIDEDFEVFAKLIGHDDIGNEAGDLTLGQVLSTLNEKGWVWLIGEMSDVTIIKA